MAATKKRLLYRARIVHDTRADLGSTYTVRKGWHYVLLCCKGCRKYFQMPYKDPGRTYAMNQLSRHRGECRGL